MFKIVNMCLAGLLILVSSAFGFDDLQGHISVFSEALRLLPSTRFQILVVRSTQILTRAIWSG